MFVPDIDFPSHLIQQQQGKKKQNKPKQDHNQSQCSKTRVGYITKLVGPGFQFTDSAAKINWGSKDVGVAW